MVNVLYFDIYRKSRGKKIWRNLFGYFADFDGKAFPTFAAAAFENGTAGEASHPFHKAMLSDSFFLFGLPSSFRHGCILTYLLNII